MVIDSQKIDYFKFTLLDDGTYSVEAGSGYFQWATKVVIPSEYNGKPVTRIAENGFKDLEQLAGGYKGLMGRMKELIIPNSITQIGKSAFEYCRSLKSITIPGSVKTIGDCAFGNCVKLKKVDIFDGVTHIGAMAFGYCTSLKHVEMTNSVQNLDGIRDYAFRGCTKLKDILIEDLDI